MGAVKDEDLQYVLKKKSKKRKKRESNSLCEDHGNIQSSDEGYKKKKKKKLGNMNSSEVAGDVDSKLGARDGSEKEKKDIEKNGVSRKNEASNSKMEKKKKKNKIEDGKALSFEEVVSEKIEPMKDKERKKKKAGDKSGADIVENDYMLRDDFHSKINQKDRGTTSCERKMDKSVISTTGGIRLCARENNEEKVIDHAVFVESQIEGRITEKVKYVKDNKRRKKKKDGLCGGSFDKELADDPIEFSTSNGESSGVDRGSKRKRGKFMVTHILGDASAVAQTNKRNNTDEASRRFAPGKKVKKVTFCDKVEYLSLADNSRGTEKLKDHGNGKKKVGGLRCREQPSKAEDQGVSTPVVYGEENHQTKKVDNGLIRGNCFSKEDEIVKISVLNYKQKHQLGEKGLEMVLKCGSCPEVRDCWREIGEALPPRPHMSVYHRANILFERSKSRSWTPEENEHVKNFQKKYGPDWKTLADEIDKHRFHVKDTCRRIRYPSMKKGRWSEDEIQALYDLVNKELRMKAFDEKKLKHGMLRDNISWEAVSERLSTRSNALCCQKWYDQLTSPLVAEGKWADADDYRLVVALDELDAVCQEDVDWDNLLEHRPGDVCRKRWYEMVRSIGEHGTKSFADQVEILSKRCCPDNTRNPRSL